ncbi:MAG: hypothetical protein R3C32_01790 [Chloroflexota bacterium]
MVWPLVASLIRRVATGALGTASRTVLFLPQVIPLVAAGMEVSDLAVVQERPQSGQALSAVGLRP